MLKTSGVGTICRLLNVLAGFGYRTAFIYLLSERYLGINGLFWDIFRLFALAELGIGAAICYRFYKPIAEGDVRQVGRLMGFFRSVYLLISGAILLMGLAAFPFLDHLIKDMSEVPADVNLHIVYLLFLFQSVATYLFSYRLSIWAADRKNYVTVLASQTVELMRYGGQLLVLWSTRDFTLTLLVGIGVTLGMNYLLSVWTTHRYATVFAVTDRLPREERLQIFKDAGALMLHRIGGTVVSSTDSVVIAKFVGISAVGFYSNYALLYSSLWGIVNQMFGGITSNLGNAYAKESEADLCRLFRRVQFLGLAVSGFCAAMFYLLAGPFIRIWLGDRMCLGGAVEICLAVQVFVHLASITIGAHTMASGLFVRDRVRPLIEAALNLGISIALVRTMGLAGVFIGTLASSFMTAAWRQPYLLFKHRLHQPVWLYWRQYFVMAVLPLVFAAGIHTQLSYVPESWASWVSYAMTLAAAYLVSFLIAYGWMAELRYFFGKVSCLLTEKLARLRAAARGSR